MNERKYSKILTVVLIIIIVAIIALLGYLGYSYYKKIKLKNNASEYVDAFDSTIETEIADTSTDSTVDYNLTSDITTTTATRKNLL